MEPFLTLLGVTAGVLAREKWQGRPLREGWPLALRCGLSALFVLTGSAHFTRKRAELVAMVPPALPQPGALVTLTGVLELAGAAALWPSRTQRGAAAGLGVLLVALFPANLHLARQLNIRPHQRFLPRTAMQAVYLLACGALWADSRRTT